LSTGYGSTFDDAGHAHRRDARHSEPNPYKGRKKAKPSEVAQTYRRTSQGPVGFRELKQKKTGVIPKARSVALQELLNRVRQTD